MKIFELLTLHRTLLRTMDESGIKVEDARYIGLYAEFIAMTAKGDKATWAIANLAEKYGICERKAWMLVRHLGSDCSFDAVK